MRPSSSTTVYAFTHLIRRYVREEWQRNKAIGQTSHKTAMQHCCWQFITDCVFYIGVCLSVGSLMNVFTYAYNLMKKKDGRTVGQTVRRDSNIVAADSSEVVHSHSVWVLCGRINISLRIYIHGHPTHSYERNKPKSGEKVMLYFASSLFICLRLINITKRLRCSIYKCVSNPYLCENLQNLANSVRRNGNRTNK